VRVTFLGTGAAWGVPVLTCRCSFCQEARANPSLARTRSSLLIRSNREVLLIDPGPDVRRQLLAAGEPQVDAVLVSHGHPDHMIGLDDLAGYFHIKDGRVRPSPIPLHATPETFDYARQAFAHLFRSSRPRLQWHEMRPGLPLEALATRVIPFKTFHGATAPGSVGFLIEDQGERVIYTADLWVALEGEGTAGIDGYVEPSPFGPEGSGGVDLLISELTFLSDPSERRKMLYGAHLSLPRLLKLVRAWQPSELALIHLNHAPGLTVRAIEDRVSHSLEEAGLRIPFVIPRDGEAWDGSSG
jgi:phosphoribosyl 1,2-cyclic phosphate phosphodiesterase